MTVKAQELLAQVLALDPADRSEVLVALMGTEDGPPDPYPTEEAWRAEMSRRLDEVENHPDRLGHWEELKAELLARCRPDGR